MEVRLERRRQQERRADLRAGQICAQIVNWAGRVSRSKVSAEDFFSFDDDAEDTPERTRSALMMWAERTQGVHLA